MVNDFEKRLAQLINEFGMERESNPPDFILASYLIDALCAWNVAARKRQQFYGRTEKECG